MMRLYEPLLDVKPCPFCGKAGDVRIMTEEFFNRVVDEHGDSLVDIECKRCSLALRVYASETPDDGYQERRAALIAKWNRRGGRKR